MILSNVKPPSERRSRWAAPASVLGILLLAGCMPSAPPEDEAAGPPPAPAPPAMASRPQALGSLDLPLNPLANKDQLLRSFQPGRRDPFGGVIVPQVVTLPKTTEGESGATAGVVGSGAAGSGGASAGSPALASAGPGGKDGACDSLVSSIQVTGLIHGAGSSEAIVNSAGETGTLRPGDRGGRSTSLLPPGCQVQSIDVNAGYLVIAPIKKGRAVKLAL